MKQPVWQRGPDKAGVQDVYRFPNGYGASVVMGPHTYGGPRGLWELAVVRFTGEDNNSFVVVYDTGVTNDVVGWLDEAEVLGYLAQIEALP